MKLNGIKLTGMDLVEVAPDYNHSEITSLIAARLVLVYMCLEVAAVLRQ